MLKYVNCSPFYLFFIIDVRMIFCKIKIRCSK